MGQIMFIGAIVAFVAAAAMLSLLAAEHGAPTPVPAEAEVFSGRTATAQERAPAV